jgi:hypothetical protein
MARTQFLWRCPKCGETRWGVGKPDMCKHRDDVYKTSAYRSAAARVVAERGGKRVEVSSGPDMETR